MSQEEKKENINLKSILTIITLFLIMTLNAEATITQNITQDTSVSSTPSSAPTAEGIYIEQNGPTTRIYMMADNVAGYYATNVSFYVYGKDAITSIVEYYYCDDWFNETNLTWANQGTVVSHCDASPFTTQSGTNLTSGAWQNFALPSSAQSDSDGKFTIKMMFNPEAGLAHWVGVNTSESAAKPYFTYELTSPTVIITAKNTYNTTTINTFNVTITNGTTTQTYGTTNGTIDTNISRNDTNLWNVTFFGATNIYNQTYQNMNITLNLQGNLTQYPGINLINLWNNTNIATWNITINGTTYTTTTNTIYTLINNTNTSATAKTTDHFNTTQNLNLTPNTIINITTYQSQINFTCKETITNITVNCVNNTNVSSATTIYPNAGTYNWIISANTTLGYYNNKTTTQTITALQNSTITIEDFYNKNISLYDNYSYTLISGQTCEFGTNTSITGNPIRLGTLAGYTNLTCYKALEYPTQTIAQNYTTETVNQTLNPYTLTAFFSTTTSGTITDINRSQSFTNATLILKQNEFPIGKVTLQWNNGTQITEYYNDMQTTITMYLLVSNETLSVSKTIKATSQGSLIEGARITAEEWDGNQTIYRIIYGKLSDSYGETTLLLPSYKVYRVTVQKDGYTSAQTIVPTTNTASETFTVELTPTTSASSDYINTNCENYADINQTCTFTIICGEATCSYTLINYTLNTSGVVTTTTTTTSTTTGTTYTLSIPINTTQITITAGTTDTEETYTPTIRQTNTTMGENITQFRPENIKGDNERVILYSIFIVFFAAIAAGVAERKVQKGTGIWAAIGWFLIWGKAIPFFLVVAFILFFIKATPLAYKVLVRN